MFHFVSNFYLLNVPKDVWVSTVKPLLIPFESPFTLLSNCGLPVTSYGFFNAPKTEIIWYRELKDSVDFKLSANSV